MTIRVALIGAGIMGADHARIIATQIPGAVLQVVCDADRARAKAIADTTGARGVSQNPLAAIADRSVDAVLIASPDATHGEFTLAAIAARKPALCEKPLAPSASECLKIIDAEVTAGKRLVQVGFMRRFDPAYVEMKAIRQKGEAGAPRIFHCIHRNVSAPTWFTPDMAITNSAPHEFDIGRFVLDCEYTSISVFQPGTIGAAKSVAPVMMVVQTTSGELVTIEVNVNAAYGYDVRGELVCQNGSISLRAPAHSEVSLALASSIAYPADWRPRFAEAYRLQNQAWIGSVATELPAGASAWDGYAATLAAEAGVAALSRGTPVAISAVAKPPMY